MKYQSTDRKFYIFLFLFLVGIGLLLASALRLQLIEGQANLALASATNRSREVVRAPRGIIYDVKGRPLVVNEAAFNVYVYPSEVRGLDIDDYFAELGELLDLDSGQLQSRFERSAYNAQGQLVGERVTVHTNLDYEKFLATYSEIETTQGVYVINEAKRTYINSENMANILGYLGDISASELEQFPGLDARARVGKDGIEKMYDAELRGQDGFQLRDAAISRGDSSGWIPQNYKIGDNAVLTIDIDWQNALYNYLEKYSMEVDAMGGAAVIMESDSGRVRAMANYPTYDINWFAQGITQEQFSELIEDDRSPLLNRAIAMQIPTGSVFKVIMAAILQQEGSLNSNTRYDSGCFELPGDYRICEADNRNYGNLDLYNAITQSSNPYFCQAAVAHARSAGSDQIAIRRWAEYFDNFGLGKRLGIDLPGEQPGAMPSPELKQAQLGEGWFLADLCNTVIGQGLVSATPLQMATATAAIVNGGDVYRPQIVDHLQDENMNRDQVAVEKISELGIDEQHLDTVVRGMELVVSEGTAFALRDSPGNPIAKTGSSEASVRTQSGQTVTGAHSWVVGSFEHEGQNYTFAVALQFGGRGFRSVPIMAEFLDCLYSEFDECAES